MKPYTRPVLVLLISVSWWFGASAESVKVGAGSYLSAPKGNDRAVPTAPFRSPAMLATAAQTNQWYSSLIFNPKPEVLFVQPLTIQATMAGLELALPDKQVITTERKDVEIHYPHRDPVIISPVAFQPGTPKLAKVGDWSIDMSMGSGADDMLVTLAHGSPFAFVRLSRGDLRIRLPAVGERLHSQFDARVLALSVKGKTYALFGPTGVSWEQLTATEWLGRLPPGKGYFSAGALPDNGAATLALFTRHAYAFIQDTKAIWKFDEKTSQLETTFTATTELMEGQDKGALLGLYPHQWFNNSSVEARVLPGFDTVRGPLRLLEGNSFKTSRTYAGFVPFWPGISDISRKAELAELAKTDHRNARRLMLEEGKGPYWQGKGLQRISKLMEIAEQQGDSESSDQLLKLMKSRFEQWFSGADSKTYFHYDKALGTVVSYPEEFFFVEQLNDHHFTYGYWIKAAADIALRDPAWAAKDKWGGMVELLIADIATPRRGGADFPYLRNFDAYEGHSWASGIGLGSAGNNQESSSEAINAWAGLILWAEATGSRELRDLGIYLYTTEVEAINHYWFDIHHKVFPAEYTSAEASMVFGGKYAHNTWWTDEPRQIKGINLLPITTSSTYLATDPAYIKRSMAALKPEMDIFSARGKSINPSDIWQDTFAQYTALADPQAGLAQWKRWGSFELGDTRTHAFHWIQSLIEMGTPDLNITADTALYSVFKQPDGRKTYLAYNASKVPVTVRFSDGKQLQVAPGQLGSAK